MRYLDFDPQASSYSQREIFDALNPLALQHIARRRAVLANRQQAAQEAFANGNLNLFYAIKFLFERYDPYNESFEQLISRSGQTGLRKKPDKEPEQLSERYTQDFTWFKQCFMVLRKEYNDQVYGERVLDRVYPPGALYQYISARYFYDWGLNNVPIYQSIPAYSAYTDQNTPEAKESSAKRDFLFDALHQLIVLNLIDSGDYPRSCFP